jgi:hypothetical protein
MDYYLELYNDCSTDFLTQTYAIKLSEKSNGNYECQEEINFEIEALEELLPEHLQERVHAVYESEETDQ